MNETEEIISSLSVIDTENIVETELEGYKVSEIIGPSSLIRLNIHTEWMLDDSWTFAFLNSLKTIDINEIIKAQASEGSGSPSKAYKIQDGVAYIDISGAMMKKPSCMSMLMGSDGSYIQYRAAIRSAVNDEAVKAIALIIDSPGGEVSGAFDLANDVYILSQKKPIYAYIEDMGASAAYLIASQALTIWSNENAITGSIGVYTSVKDSSKAEEEKGNKIYVIKAGKYKGGDVPGAKVTDEYLSSLQNRVDGFQSLFVKSIVRGRNMNADDMTKVADASVYIGSAAKKVKLIDNVGTLDNFHDKITSKKMLLSRKDSQMSASLSDVNRWIEGAPIMAETTSPVTEVTESPLVVQLQQNKVVDKSTLDVLLKQAEFGRVQETKVREQASALAVVALGAEDGEKAKDIINSLPIEQVQGLAKQYISIGQSKGLINQSGVPLERTTTGSGNLNANTEDVISAVAGTLDKITILKKNAQFLIEQDKSGLYLPL